MVIVFLAFSVLSVSKPHYTQKEEPQYHVADVAPDVVEGTQYTHWIGALKVVIALILIPTGVQKLQVNQKIDSVNKFKSMYSIIIIRTHSTVLEHALTRC